MSSRTRTESGAQRFPMRRTALLQRRLSLVSIRRCSQNVSLAVARIESQARAPYVDNVRRRSGAAPVAAHTYRVGHALVSMRTIDLPHRLLPPPPSRRTDSRTWARGLCAKQKLLFLQLYEGCPARLTSAESERHHVHGQGTGSTLKYGCNDSEQNPRACFVISTNRPPRRPKVCVSDWKLVPTVAAGLHSPGPCNYETRTPRGSRERSAPGFRFGSDDRFA
eukprot:6186585-Pleurochrysis_carterae.AAC.8